ncbi:hypothetical protein HNR60_000628 [Rhodopseudomonas rhenobacensis]|uniref:Conjugal transfer protein TraD n=1 Tax=Rhodopseudomonas rhenobacensis TaxID=87461 RepID=A0A7W7Z0R3_9BRAD|nr:hypothetical protein [Rhodopseudomonas rhenobacensis]
MASRAAQADAASVELGGLVVKAGVVELTGDDRAIILGALLWMADKLRSDQREYARRLWAAKGMEAFALERATDASTISQETPQDRTLPMAAGAETPNIAATAVTPSRG